MNKKLRVAVFKLIDIMVIFTMVFASPMSLTASAMSQDSGPALATDESNYEIGDSARVTGSGFDAGEYVLAADRDNDDDILDWGSVTVDDSGAFVTDSPTLDADGAYEVRAYASEWSGDWEETPIASTDFTVNAPPPPTETPTEEPTATEPPTAEPTLTQTEEPTVTESPTEEPTNTPTEEPTAGPTNTSTEEPTATEPPTAEPTNTSTDEPTATEPATVEPTATQTEEPTTEPTNTPTVEPTNTATTEPTPAGPPYIQSDKADYAPGELVTLTGGNWQGDNEVRIIINDDIGQSWRRDVITSVGAEGSINYSFNLPTFFVANYSVTATGQQTNRVATTSFTDLSVGTYDQCSNDDGDGFSTGDTGCRWINGNLQSNNSTYFEGDATVQRLWLTGFIPGSTHTVTLKYGTTKGGKHAYDFLTTWDWSESWIAVADRCQTITGCTTANETMVDIPQDPNVPNSFEPSAPGDRQFVMRGGTLNSATTPTIASGSYAGDSETVITISFTVASSGAMCPTTGPDAGTCSVALWFGAHVAAQANWGLGQGAGSISGSPYHVALDAVDNASVGQRDNQMQANTVTVIPNGTIVIVKDAVPNDAQDFSFVLTNNDTITQNFSLDDDADGTLPNSQTFSVPPGMWTATELNIPSGWTLTNLVCTDPTNNTTVNLGTATANINLASAETVTCTYTDTSGGRIIVDKVTNPSGDTQSFSFDASGGSYADFSLTDAAAPNNQALSPGNYSVSETMPAGWDLTGSSCTSSIGDTETPATIELDAGEAVTCTFTNTKRGHIIVDKVTTPSNDPTSFNFDASGGSSPAYTDFTLTDAATPNDQELMPGSYSVSESVPTGWNLSSSTCTSSISDAETPGNIELDAGETVTCTFNNEQQAATLIVKKVVVNNNGGTKTASDFSFQVNGGSATAFEADGQNDLTVSPGTYSVTEPAVAGYSTTYNNCSNLSIPAGGSATCTITNDDQPGTLIVIKHVINDNGGTATDADFALDSGGANDSPDDFAGAEAPGTTVALDAGSYDVTETGPAGYMASFSADCSGLIANGETKTCTVTNDDNAPSLTLMKVVVNDNGGTATEGDFTLIATGPVGSETLVEQLNVNSAQSTPTYSTNSLQTGVTYRIEVSGTYSNGSSFVADAECRTGDAWATATDTGPILDLLAVYGSNIGTSHFNSAQGVTAQDVNWGSCAGSHIYSLTIVGDGGNIGFVVSDEYWGDPGPYCSSAFCQNNGTFDNSGTLIVKIFEADNSGGFSGNGPSVGSGANFEAGTYNLSETGPAGYSASAWECVGGTQDDDDTITLGLGESATCTITNDDQPGTLIVKKVVVNDNGGTLDPEDFSFQVNGGTAITFEADGQNNLTVNAGTYTVTESTVAGYSTSYDNCTDLMIPNGGSATCTITNNDQAATLIVKKVVINDNGGTLTANAFSFSVNGGDPVSFEADGQNDLTVNAGTYTITEPTVAGYTTTYDNCTGVVVSNGGTATCTITNDDNAGTLIVKKEVVNNNGGTLAAGDFSFSVNGDDPIAFEADGENQLTVSAGTYTITEPAVSGYSTSYDNCTDVLVPNGGSATCTITNDDQPGTLIVKKVVINDNGGTKVATDFSFQVNGGSTVSFLQDGVDPLMGKNTLTVNAGSYNVTEPEVTGYTTTYDNCSNVLVANGGTQTCTITNDDQAGTIIVEKQTDPDGLAGDFEFTGDAVGTISDGEQITVSGLSAGTYTATELVPDGWQLKSIVCSDTNSTGGVDNATATFNLENGETVTCVFTNDPLPTISLSKVANPTSLPEPGGDFEFTLTITNTSAETVQITTLTDTQSGAADFTDCADLVGMLLLPGEAASCTYTVAHTDAGSYENTASVTVADNENNTASDTDDETVTVTDVLPTVDLTKDVTPATLPEPGGVFTFTLTITNTSVEDVTITGLGDSNVLSPQNTPECLALVGMTLTPGQSVSCEYDVTHTEAGTYENTASVTVADNEGNPAEDSDSETVTVTDVLPTVTLEKSADPLTLPEPGGVFTFTLSITNTSPEAVTITDLTDNQSGATDFSNCAALIGTTLAANGGTTSCTYTVTHTDAGTYDNTAEVKVADDEGNEASDSDDETVTVENVMPTITVTKDASPASVSEPGGNVVFTFTVTNTSPEPVTIASLSDTDFTLTGDADCQVGTVLPVSGSCQFTQTEIITGDASGPDHENTFTATATDNEGNTATASDNAIVGFDDVTPTVTIDKAVDDNEKPEPGGVFTYTLTITNTSPETVEITALADTNALSQECQDLVGTFLDPGEVVSCQYTATFTNAGTYSNTANVTVTDDEGNEGSDDDSETVTVTDVLPTVDLTKTADPLTLPEPGGVFTFTLTITNTSVENVTITGLGDSNVLSPQNTPECLALVGTTLTPGQSISCEYDVTHTEAGSYENTASVTVADNEGNPAEDSDSETVTVTDALPSVDLTKTADPLTLPEPGGVFTFTLSITNTSPEAVTITALTDDNALSTECTDLIGTSIPAGGTVSCTYTVTHTDAGSYENTASVTVADNENNTASDSDDESVTVTDVLPNVDLTKTADPLTLPEPGGVFTFTLTITNTSVETVEITALTDDNALSQECQDLVGTTLAAGASTSCTYTVTHTDAGSYPNTASVTVEDNETNQASDSDDETVAVTDVTPTVDLNKSVDDNEKPEPGGVFTFTLTITNTSVETVTITALTDDNALSQECQDLVGTILGAGLSASCSYTVTHTDAGSYPNTASVTVQDNEDNTASDTDDETVTVTDVAPTVDIVKSADPTTLPEPGGVFTFTLTITNTSMETVAITALSDTQSAATDFSDCSALVGMLLLPGESVSCTYTATRTDAGSYDNTASVTVADNENNAASDSDDETVTVTDVTPTVTLDKFASPSSLPEPGGVFTFTLTITNTSVEPVTITALTDDNALSAECLALIGATLDAGASTSCQYTVTHTDAGSYENTASVTVADNENNTASDTDDETVTVTDVLPTVDLTKTADPLILPEPGGVFTFTLTITNTSVEDVTITGLGDSNVLSPQNTPECLALVGMTLTPGQSVSCEYDVTHTEAGTYENTASVTVADNEGNPAEDSDSETVTVTDVLPTVTLEKSADPTTLPEPGGVFTFTLSITNTSVEPVTIAAFDDTQTTACDYLVGMALAVSESVTCTYTVTHTDAGSYTNTASVTVADNEGNEASDSDDETVTVTDVLPTVTLDKSADPTTLPEPGGVFTFTLNITNSSVEDVTITALTDENTLSQECLDLIGNTLTPGETVTCIYTVTHTDAGSYPNTASVTVADNEGNAASDSDDETVTVTDVLPTVDLTKTADPLTLPEPGGVFTFTLGVTNTSVETVTITILTDDNALSAQCLALVGTTLAAGASTSCQYTVTHTDAGSYPNTASVTVEDDEGNAASDSDDETVTVTDVTPTVDIVKSASPSSLPEPGGTFTFTLSITNTSVETVTITALSDTQSAAANFSACAALVGISLAAGASTSCQYTVTHTDAGSYLNTASVTVEDDEGNDASDSDDETVTVTDVLPTVTLDKSVSPTSLTVGQSAIFTLTITNTSVESVSIAALTDTNALSAQCLALIGTTLAAGASTSCTYTVTYLSPGSFNNTATVTVEDNEDNQASDSDDATVTVNKATPSIVTTPNPASGKLGVILNDSANLSNGFNPSGTITFRLYDPKQPSCTGTPRFTQVVTVNGNGTYTTTGGFMTDRVGTWRWTATYSGDANNNTAISGCNAELVQVSFHPGTIGFWKNWRNHYTSAQAQLLINYLKTNNPRVYNKDLILNNSDDFTIAKWDAIFNVGTRTPREQMILAQFTALKLNLAITQLDGTGGLVQKNDDLCTAGVVDVSSISGATAFFGTSTPTVGQIVNAVENRWTGNLTTNRNNWTWNLTNAQKDMIINVVTGINEGTLVMSSGCP